jgi:hypothetical protein
VFAHEAATTAVFAHEAADHPPGRQARTRSATSRRLSGMVIAEQPGAQRISATHDQAIIAHGSRRDVGGTRAGVGATKASEAPEAFWGPPRVVVSRRNGGVVCASGSLSCGARRGCALYAAHKLHKSDRRHRRSRRRWTTRSAVSAERSRSPGAGIVDPTSPAERRGRSRRTCRGARAAIGGDRQSIAVFDEGGDKQAWSEGRAERE